MKMVSQNYHRCLLNRGYYLLCLNNMIEMMYLRRAWTPVFIGVKIYCESINYKNRDIESV